MLLRSFYDEKLAQASYLVGCQSAGKAIVIDPARNIEPYLKMAEENGLVITGVAETHIHADFVSGALEIAARANATVYQSGLGGEDGTYCSLSGINQVFLNDQDRITIGNVTLEVMHTPGHTPEHISYIVTDGAKANQPIGIFSGDFIFAGDVGRPDLLEKAVGVANASQEGARQMFRSVQRIKTLGDYLQIWPGHGSGSACGKALGAIPSTTLGYEKSFNPAFSYDNEEEFISYLLADQPEPPAYFSIMKKVNGEGADLLSDLAPNKKMGASRAKINEVLNENGILIDVRSADQFASGHIPGSINIPYEKSFLNWTGSLIQYDCPLYLIAEDHQLVTLVPDLHSIGLDKIKGWFSTKAVQIYEADGGSIETYEEAAPSKLIEDVKNQRVTLIDVRNLAERKTNHIDYSVHIVLGDLPKRIAEISTDKPIVIHCASGKRSAIATSILQANGIKNVSNLRGGIIEWELGNCPTVIMN
ncbi:MBL fold metallo-hydrolase [Pseudalkalibacillus decolorationis]|uniref:MBL fold metallo-hydrolase n=1 Tax=Pseudalkalibacillus decolorationis TaxID=163879 RepID=UPI0021473676|nr:MBL fold metallo-hydrolase [Pseudalkalibacillus decolorationis]